MGKVVWFTLSAIGFVVMGPYLGGLWLCALGACWVLTKLMPEETPQEKVIRLLQEIADK